MRELEIQNVCFFLTFRTGIQHFILIETEFVKFDSSYDKAVFKLPRCECVLTD